MDRLYWFSSPRFHLPPPPHTVGWITRTLQTTRLGPHTQHTVWLDVYRFGSPPAPWCCYFTPHLDYTPLPRLFHYPGYLPPSPSPPGLHHPQFRLVGHLWLWPGLVPSSPLPLYPTLPPLRWFPGPVEPPAVVTLPRYYRLPPHHHSYPSPTDLFPHYLYTPCTLLCHHLPSVPTLRLPTTLPPPTLRFGLPHCCLIRTVGCVTLRLIWQAGRRGVGTNEPVGCYPLYPHTDFTRCPTHTFPTHLGPPLPPTTTVGFPGQAVTCRFYHHTQPQVLLRLIVHIPRPHIILPPPFPQFTSLLDAHGPHLTTTPSCQLVPRTHFVPTCGSPASPHPSPTTFHAPVTWFPIVGWL